MACGKDKVKYMKNTAAIMWFRQDLRLADNPALAKACEHVTFYPIYIFDPVASSGMPMGGASKVYLHHALKHLQEELGGRLSLYFGDSVAVIKKLIDRYQVSALYSNIGFEPTCVATDNAIMAYAKERSAQYIQTNGNYIWHPDAIYKDDKNPYKVFTPYKRKAMSSSRRALIPIPNTSSAKKETELSVTLEELALLPKEKWGKAIASQWEYGEKKAMQKVETFIKEQLSGYKEGRNHPAKNQTSNISMHLHFGELSPTWVYDAVSTTGPQYANDADIEHYLSELTWREFSINLLRCFPKLASANFNPAFDSFPWEENKDYLQKWQEGQTGIPIVDAGMRQLYQEGYMHNRVRMITASFLVKNLRLHWRHGFDWFWECLVDADYANNAAGWQWVAGSGADAAPYFRVFNPILQGEKFDKDGSYTKKYLPELSKLPRQYIFKPWEAPGLVLQAADVRLGDNYPRPIVDLASSRDQALAAYQLMRGKTKQG